MSDKQQGLEARVLALETYIRYLAWVEANRAGTPVKPPPWGGFLREEDYNA